MANATEQPKPLRVVDRGRFGAVILFDNGFESAVPTVEMAKVMLAGPVAHTILLQIHEHFRHHNPVDPSVLMLGDDRTLKEAVEAYVNATA